MLRALGIEKLKGRVEFADRSTRSFASELRISSDDRRRIGELYASQRPRLTPGRVLSGHATVDDLLALHDAKISVLWETILSMGELEESMLHSVQWSLIHMRMNRLFTKEQRRQEAATWELLRRSYLELQHNARYASEDLAHA
jgi:hypothetical protein